MSKVTGNWVREPALMYPALLTGLGFVQPKCLLLCCRGCSIHRTLMGWAL